MSNFVIFRFVKLQCSCTSTKMNMVGFTHSIAQNQVFGPQHRRTALSSAVVGAIRTARIVFRDLFTGRTY